MDLELTRIDYGNIGPTSLNCLKLLPNEYRKQQKIAVGDFDGNLQLFSVKKSEAHTHFQTFVGKKISSLQLGGAPGTSLDKIFVATDNIVKGYNKKGKMFLSFDSNLTEPIKCMFVSGADLITCGNHVYAHYRDCKDIGTYLCGDTIVDVVALCPNNTNRVLTILACSGRVLRILEHCRVRQTVELDSVPTTLHVPKNVLGDRIICGFADGKISMFYFGHFTGEVKQQILIKPEVNPSAITCIDTYDMSGEGREDLIIGRRDGTIQVFSLPASDEVDIEPRQLYRECFPESISAVQGGCVYCNGFSEIVVLTYAGSIFGLTTQVISISLSDKEVFRKPLERGINNNNNNKTLTETTDNAITAEIMNLSLVKPQENYKLSTQVTTTELSAVNLLDINDAFILQKEDASYILSIEMPVPILEVLFQSELLIELLQQTDSNAASITENKMDPTSGFQFSVKIRMKDGRHRLETQFQTSEGQYGNLEAYIMPNIQPSCVQVKTYPIRPLSLHIRIHFFEGTRPFNILTLKGTFTQAEMHNWIEQCIPEVPERPSIGEAAEFYFKNVLIGTILECKCGKGFAQFRSDNLSTISTLKDFLTKEATKKRIKLEISSEISEPSIPHVLKLIEPMILKCNKIKTEYKFLQALLQVDIKNEDDFNCLMPEYQSILNRRKEIEENYKTTPSILSRFFGIINDFYIDRFKFKGIFVKDKIADLVKLLENYNFDDVLNFFNSVKAKEMNAQQI